MIMLYNVGIGDGVITIDCDVAINSVPYPQYNSIEEFIKNNPELLI